VAETIRDVVIKIGLQQTNNKLQAPDTTAFESALERLQKSYAEVGAASAAAHTEMADSHQDAVTILIQEIELHERLEEEIKDNRDAFADHAIKTGEGLRTIGDGLFTAARGLTLLGASEEDIQVIAQRVAEIQGMFDAFRGTIDVVKGIYETTKAVTAATTAYSAAQTASATANEIYTVSTVRATAATNSFTASLARNPLGLLVIGLTAAAGAFLLYQTSAVEASEATDDAVDDTNAKLADQNKLLQERNQLSNEYNERQIARSQLQYDTERLRLLNEQADAQKQIALIEQQQAANFGLNDIDTLSRRATVDNPFGLEAAVRAGLELSVVIDEQLRLEEEKLRLIEQQAGARDQDLQTAKATLRSIQEQLAVEKQKNATIAEGLGRLDPIQQAELRQLSQKASAGQSLNNAELQRLEQLGGGGVRDFTSEQFRQRGAGLVDLLNPFRAQDQQKVASLEQQRDLFSEIVGDVEADVKALQADQEQRAMATTERIIALMDQRFVARTELEFLEDRLAQVNLQ
jgi:hypothetical protein